MAKTRFSENVSFVFGFMALSVISSLLMIGFDSAAGISYSNHTSDAYKIQFQYPTNWTVEEKKSRFEEGMDITVMSNSGIPKEFSIGYSPDLIRGFGTANLQSAVIDYLQSTIRSDYSKEYRIIEPPTFTAIDGQRTGTFLYTVKDNYPENSAKLAVQHWITFKDGVGYDIMYVSTPDTFDNPDEKAIRDNLLKSIKFTGGNDMTNINNSTSRFS